MAIAAMLAIGWRQHARTQMKVPRGLRRLPLGAPVPPQRAGIVVDHVDAPEYRPPNIVRRMIAAALSSGIAVLLGILLAILISMTIAVAVIVMTNMLRG